jgi:hypothetical protein
MAKTVVTKNKGGEAEAITNLMFDLYPHSPVYVHIRDGRVINSREAHTGEVFFDFDSEGRLLGVKIIGKKSSDANKRRKVSV